MDCDADKSGSEKICDTFEVGIIGQLEYDMYDIAIMITNMPEEILVHDLATLSFRLSHDNDYLISWLATVRLFSLLVSGGIFLLYFVTGCRCKSSSLNCFSFLTLGLE